MPVTRHFLGWDSPLVQKVCDFLLRGKAGKPVDLGDLLVIVPTRQAGRRLREALALRCDELGTGLLSPGIAVPKDILRFRKPARTVASAAVVKAAWTAELLRADVTQWPSLFPSPPRVKDLAWASHMADAFRDLRATLAEGGLTAARAVQKFGDALPESDRWRDLVKVEKLYLDRVDRLELADPVEEEIAAAHAPEIPSEISRIIVAGVPDLTPLLAEALAHCANVDVLVHAPAGHGKFFDDWGRPLPDAWREREIALGEDDVQLGGSPAGQSAIVLNVFDEEAGRFPADQAALGVADPDVTPYLAAALAERGLPTFDPAGRPVTDHPLYQLLDSVRRLVREGDYNSFARFVRHADVLACLEVSALDVLGQLDKFQNEYLPPDFDDMAQRFRASAKIENKYPALFKAAKLAAKVRQRFEDEPFGAAVHETFKQVYALRQLDPARTEDDHFLSVAKLLNNALAELSDDLLAALKVNARDALDILAQEFRGERFYPERTEAAVDLEGWLELAWSEAQLVVVTGMNEGIVPDSRCADVFLPDSLRAQLGLRHEAERCARDAFLLESLIASRPNGRVVLVAGKTASSGDPLRPSRLLFRCSDKALPDRCAKLFGEAREPREQFPAHVSFMLNPNVGPANQLSALRVTMFRDYLACPFRFYLRHVLGMESMDDRKMELDERDFGTLVHAALQHLNEAPDEVALTGVLDELIRNQFGDEPPLQILIQREAARQRLRAAARAHAKSVAEGWELIATERKIKGSIGGFEVRGTIDRVERHRATGAVRLLDYKTTDAAKSPDDAHLAKANDDASEYALVSVGGKEKQWRDLQLPLYRLLLAEDPEFARVKDWQVGYFHLPKAVTETGIEVWDACDDALTGRARACAEGVVAEVRAGRFWPPRDDVDYDDFTSLFFGRTADYFLEPGR